MSIDAAAVAMDSERLGRVKKAMQQDVERGLYDGGVIIIGRHNQIVLHEVVGQTDPVTHRAAHEGDVYPIMSLTKSMVATLLLSRVEKGQVQLTTQVAEIIPEFAAKGKGRITVAQVMGHTAGLPLMPPVPVEELGNLAGVVAALCAAPLIRFPGAGVSYSALAGAYIVAEIIRRLDGGRRALRQIMKEDLFDPLGMVDTSLGRRPDLEARRVRLYMRDHSEGRWDAAMVETLDETLCEGAEVPSAGAYSTAKDYHKFAQMLAGGGALDKVRILSPLMVKLATTNQTGDLPNETWNMYRESRGWEPIPAYQGLGFYVRGEGIVPSYFGVLNSPGTFGHAGLGTSMFWVDPELDLTFVCLTAGGLEESRSMDRFNRLSDIVLAAVVKP